MLYNGINGVLIPMYSMDLESALQEAKTMISKAP